MEKEMTLKEFMTNVYDNDNTCENALMALYDEDFLKENGWFEVFHEGIGIGICSPNENIVACFDEDDLPLYHDVAFYRYNENAWKRTANGGWDKIYAGDNGEEYELEPID